MGALARLWQELDSELSHTLCRSPTHPERLLVKRLIALEGDWLTIAGSSTIQKIPQARSPLSVVRLSHAGGPDTGLQGCCWVEGDNRQDSSDSSTTFGPARPQLSPGFIQSHSAPAKQATVLQIPLALVDARVVAVCWPPERIGRVASAVPPGRLLRRNPHAVHGVWQEGAASG